MKSIRFCHLANSGLRASGPTEPIFYTGVFSAPYISKPLSHSWVDICGMVVEHTEQSGDALDLRYWAHAAKLDLNLPFFLTQTYFSKTNYKDFVVAEFVPDQYKNVFKLGFVSDEVQAIAVGIGSNLGLTINVGSDYFITTTIYIRYIRSGDRNKVFIEVMMKILGTFTYEMIRAMTKMYSKYLPDEENVNWAWHCNSWQVAAHVFERTPVRHAWLGLRLDLCRDFSAADDIVMGEYKKPL